MKSKLDIIEARLRAIIENGIGWLPWRSRQPRLAEELVDAVRAQILLESSSDQPAANVLHVFMHPNNTAAWQAQVEWQTWLLKIVDEMAREAGIHFFAPPLLALKSDGELTTREVRLIAAFPIKEVSSTAVMSASPPEVMSGHAGNDHSAFLILQNKEAFYLDIPVINIGRRSDNQLIIDDMRVSRAHAQIRSVRGKYVLFDLSSTGGTFVNGKRVTQHILTAGDVISLAGVPLIYGEEIITEKDEPGTSPAKIHSKETTDL